MITKETILHIGAGFGDHLARRASLRLWDKFIAVEPVKKGIPGKIARPVNLTWIVGQVSREEGLPLRNQLADEVNIDYVYEFLITNREEYLFPIIMDEARRVLKEDGRIIIREPRYLVELLEPVLTELELQFASVPMSIDEARVYSASASELALEFEAGDTDQEPWMIVVTPKKDQV